MTGKKLYEFAHIHQPNLFADQDLANGLEKNLDRLEVILLAGRKKAQEISDSRDLTRPGKANKLKELSEKLDEETKQWRSSMHYHKMIEQVKGEMKPIQKRTDNFGEDLKKYEIRKHLRSLDPVLQESLYREAAISQNDLILEAIQEAPIPFVFATQKQIDKIQNQRLAKQYPKEAARLHDLQIASEMADGALNGVRHALRGAGLEITGQDPVVAPVAA